MHDFILVYFLLLNVLPFYLTVQKEKWNKDLASNKDLLFLFFLSLILSTKEKMGSNFFSYRIEYINAVRVSHKKKGC